MTRFFLLLALTFLAGCHPAPPWPELRIPVNAKCTTCQDFVRCDEGSNNAAIYHPAFDLYVLQPKGFLAQLATVWDFLVQLVHTPSKDQRPLTIYAQRFGPGGGIERTVQKDLEVGLDLVQHRIVLPDGWIDQGRGGWFGPGGVPRGVCRLLAVGEGREWVRLFAESAGR